MKTMRVLVLVVAASAAVKLAGLGAWWLQPAAAAPDAAAAGRGGPDGTEEGGACAVELRGLRELLASAQAQADELARRDAELRAREVALKAVQRAAAAEVTRLEGVAKALGISATPGTGVAITKVYESMRAEDAAPILDRLDDATLRALLGRMREKQVGALLAAMSPERAVAVTKVLAGPGAGPAPAAEASGKTR